VVLVLLACLLLAFAEPPHRGPFEVEVVEYEVEALSKPFNEVVVVYPKNLNGTYPLISFAHGFMTGGPITYALHTGILKGMASHGYIVAATKSCMTGCREGRWDYYWEEQLKVLEWARGMREDPILAHINHGIGYGIAGHSMGGQATARSTTRALEHNVKAAILLHPFADMNEHIGANFQVPTAGFTGTLDGCCGEEETRHYLEDATVPTTLATIRGGLHTEPNKPNSRWEAYMAAWFKIYVEGDRGTYFDLIYNDSHPDNLCNYYSMASCEHANLNIKKY